MRNEPIRLDPSRARAVGTHELELSVRGIVCSVKFEVLADRSAIRLLGPEMSYHDADPFLAPGLKRIRPDLRPDDVLAFRRSERRVDLCFEDSWTGLFLAPHLAQHAAADLLLIHLDDHTDMMSTLLCRSGDALVDPTTGEVFDPTSQQHWERAIYSGAVNIGNYLTACYFGPARLHVRHLNNAQEGLHQCFVSRLSRIYPLIPGKEFADIDRTTQAEGSCGTYAVSSDAGELLAETLPGTRAFVHVDLDYFINDFNGASRGPDHVPDEFLRPNAIVKMERFFAALQAAGVSVDRWLIATSPGFCSAWHWPWLLNELGRRMEQFHEISNAGTD